MAKYDFKEELKGFAWFKPPLNAFVAWFAHAFWWLVPKGKKDKRIKRTKVSFVSKMDGKKLKAVLFEQKTADDGSKKPCLLYFHGGAFVFGPIWYHYEIAQEYALRTNCKVLLPRYRLAPKYKYPYAEKDAFGAFDYLVSNAEKMGIDKNSIAVGGDSAGGFLAMRTTAYATRDCLAKPRLLMMVYPVVGDDENTYSMKTFVDTPFWNALSNEKMWRMFAPKGTGEALSPKIFAKVDQVYVETAEFDCLRDGATNFAEKVQGFGGNVILNSTQGTVHGYDGVMKGDVAEKSINLRCELLKKIKK